ncbi:MAG TPA: hypothetical protein VGL23_19155, partial [Chloroflexota bacterium]
MRDSFLPTEKDFRPILNKVRGAEPDALILEAYFDESSLLLQQARDQNLKLPVFANGAVYSPQFLKPGGAARACGAPVGAGRRGARPAARPPARSPGSGPPGGGDQVGRPAEQAPVVRQGGDQVLVVRGVARQDGVAADDPAVDLVQP